MRGRATIAAALAGIAGAGLGCALPGSAVGSPRPAAIGAAARPGAMPAILIGPTVSVRVKPRVGGVRTRFTFSLVLPTSTMPGRGGSVVDTLSISGPRGARCVAGAYVRLPAAAAGQRVTVTLGPAGLGGRWCTGRYAGYVLESLRTPCSVGLLRLMCPQVVIAPRVIARFWLRVR